MTELAGSAHISFEGDLSATTLAHWPGASFDETRPLKRNTLQPKQEFVVLPLELGLVKPIISAVGGTIPRGILHVQIEKEDRLELGLYDKFAPDAMFFGPTLTPIFFATLLGDGTISQWIER